MATAEQAARMWAIVYIQFSAHAKKISGELFIYSFWPNLYALSGSQKGLHEKFRVGAIWA